MLRKFVLPALGLMVLPAFASAQFEAGNWELTLSGAGSVSNDTTASGIGGTFEVGYFATKELEVGLRQSISHISSQDSGRVFVTTTDKNGNLSSASQTRGEGWSGTTTAVADYHFDLGRLQPFVGVFAGYEYTNLDTRQFNTDGTSSKVHESSWIAGPEAGLKYFVNGTTFVYARTAYAYWFQDNNMSFFTVDFGVGFRF